MTLDQYIKEYYSLTSEAKKIKPPKPEAPKWAPFGQFAWSPHREGTPEEEDSELEKAVYKDLQAHFGDFYNKRTGLPIQTVALLQLMLRFNWYEKILHAPAEETLYRGLTLSQKDLAEYVSLYENELDMIKNVDFSSPRTIPVKNGHSTSWTNRKKITKDFSDAKGDAELYSVTLIANVSDNPNKFLAGPGGLYDVRGLSMYHLEKESVGLEPILVRRIEWSKID